MSEIRKMSIWDFECLKCQEAGREDPIQIILGAASNGKAKDNEVLCGFCDEVIFVYKDEELETYEKGSVYGDNEELRQIMAGNHPIQQDEETSSDPKRGEEE